MRVNPVGNLHKALDVSTIQNNRNIGTGREVKQSSSLVTSRVGDDRTQDVPENAETTNESTKGRAHGVLRNLEAGHFNGVADARLRINFAEELNARAADRQSEILKTASVEFSSSIGSAGTDFVGSLELDETAAASVNNLLATFQQEADTLTSGATTAESLGSLEADLQQSFQSLVENLQDLFTTSTTSPDGQDTTVDPGSTLVNDRLTTSDRDVDATQLEDTKEPIATDIGTETINNTFDASLTTALKIYQSAFSQALASLVASLESGSTTTTQSTSEFNSLDFAIESFTEDQTLLA